MKKMITTFAIVAVSFVCIACASIGDKTTSMNAVDSKNNNVKLQANEKNVSNSVKTSIEIGDIGPGGGIVFYIDGNRAYECSKSLGQEYRHDEAKAVCSEYRGGGYDDWYMPNKDELNYIYQNLRKPGKILDRDYYWSSTEDYNDFAWLQIFDDVASGCQLSKWRGLNFCAIAIRSFLLPQ